MHTTDIDEFYKEIGVRIRDFRLLAGLSQEILAENLNLTRASIINLEKGRHRPSLHLLVEISSLLMIHYTSLIPDKNPTPISTSKIASLNLKNAISDQEKIEKATKASLENFFQSIQRY